MRVVALLKQKIFQAKFHKENSQFFDEHSSTDSQVHNKQYHFEDDCSVSMHSL